MQQDGVSSQGRQAYENPFNYSRFGGKDSFTIMHPAIDRFHKKVGAHLQDNLQAANRKVTKALLATAKTVTDPRVKSRERGDSEN